MTQNGFDERVILVGGGATNDARWPVANNMANLAWHVFRGRWFAPQSIRYLNAGMGQDLDADGTNDVSALPALAGLAAAITNWAAASDKLTLCLIGDGTNGTFRLNETENLTPQSLAAWLDSYQASNREVCVIMDFPGSGAFLPFLTPPAGRTRLSVASAKANQNSSAGNGGWVSFCQYFFSDVFSGYDIGTAFNRARDAIRNITGRLKQEAQLDDNGDGISDKHDGALARTRHIGSAFVTGADAPVIGTVMPGTLPSGTNSPLLWVADVTAMAGISNVWCLITPPDYDGQGDLPQTNLTWNAGRNRYEAPYGGLTGGGTYMLTFHAVDRSGEMSSPMQTQVLAPDAYEPDDTPLQAAGFDVGAKQSHNFHATNDVDWVKFYAVTNYHYSIRATQQGTNVDAALVVYGEWPDGTLTNMGSVDYNGQGTGVTEEIGLDPVEPGMYYVQASSVDGWGVGSEYELEIRVDVGGGCLIVVAVDKLDPGHSPPGAVVIVDGTRTQAFNGATSLAFTDLPVGVHTARVPAVAGYLPEEDPAEPNQVANPASTLYGNPRSAPVVDETWKFAVFQFVPYVRVDEATRVKDGWTGAGVPGVGVSFRATSGLISNCVYAGYPAYAAYKSNWQSGVGGNLPTNVWLPAVSYNLTLTGAGYSNGIWGGVIATPAPGSVLSLGAFSLIPLDTNGNGLADSWETAHFGPGTNVDPQADADHDGQPNGLEYLAGTDPNDPGDVFKVRGLMYQATNGLTLVWPVTGGRRYQVLGREELTSGGWRWTNGPWEAAMDQTHMQWTDTNSAAFTSRFYHVDLLAP